MVIEEAGLPATEALYEHAPCGLLITQPNGTIERVNQTFCRWLGLEREAVLGRRFQDLLNMAGRVFLQTHWAPLLQTQGSIAEVKVEMIHADGRSIPLMLNAVRREYPTGVLHELAVFLAEERNKYERELLAARKMAEELLQHQMSVQSELTSARNRLRLAHAEAEIRAIFAEQMVGIVSHDLRNPLAAIKMAAGLLERSLLEPRQQRFLGQIHHSTDRAERMIVDLLDFTQARVGQGINLSMQSIDLHATVARGVEELRLTFTANALIHRMEGEGACVADPDRLLQLVGNLVSNAVTYGAPDSDIVITSAFEANVIKVSVHNRGEPIPMEKVDSLYEPAVRVVSDSDETRTVGLGLFIVREIIRAHLGDINVRSSAEEGTTFTATLPRPAA
ncbi:PAS domain-containing sensor histidine kinase [Pseudomonas viridiflava]|uniref:PAS domain-containing sensor histidine kinase n=1 Tax=Pseudomonas syringae group TaxID=136849 RepID=UPI0005B724C1|nr:PAS domain-containing sensor histidine kinase [Pseudomonas viridiflava]KIQ30254.1 histidine kinase [Pseudomonas viridiflava]MEE4082601.1 PAS domain-containing sensor histidine kinase [Pseudomonas viridiflava]MEE4100270.1 PAS domain-containing sensor histidine kinase [Pseudomonas viridiflava]MEE4182417.1 PAS domain-containing sensor histidine kinase [Pseudomonas viridiflava]MEE4233731.1 PAS domain-containing sensor histidine kinase [Pseudomonas viridiflava]